MVEPPRPALTREQVVSTAVELIDDAGLDALSVRTLATRLGVTPMAIYWHVSDKDDLLTAVLDSVLAEIDGTDLPEAPFDALIEVGRRYRASFARHPRVAPLLAERPSPEGPAAAALMAETVELLRAAGLDDAAAASGYVLLAQFVMGPRGMRAAPIQAACGCSCRRCSSHGRPACRPTRSPSTPLAAAFGRPAARASRNAFAVSSSVIDDSLPQMSGWQRPYLWYVPAVCYRAEHPIDTEGEADAEADDGPTPS